MQGGNAPRALGLGGLLWIFALGPVSAASLSIEVAAGGAPLAAAVVSLHSASAAAAALPGKAELDQREGQFSPRVLPVTVGTEVGFPNSDKVRHHVYSFSPTKRFELPLFSGRAPNPVVFDRAGIATLGCNIHDWMVAYVVVLDTPYFAMTDAEGTAALTLPEGEYRLHVWHERLAPGSEPIERDIVLTAAGLRETVALDLAAPPPPRPAPAHLRQPPPAPGD